jgi:hypothetical protein
MRFFVATLALLMVSSFASTRLAAQTQSTGDVVGVVLDPSNAVIPNAKVTLKDVRGVTQDLRTNRDGVYRFSLLLPGSYTLRGSAPGFSTETRLSIAPRSHTHEVMASACLIGPFGKKLES